MTSLNWAEQFYYQTELSKVNPVTGDGALEYLARSPRGVLDMLKRTDSIQSGESLASFLAQHPFDIQRKRNLISENLEEIILYEKFSQVSSVQEKFQKTPRRLLKLGLTTVTGYLGYKYNGPIQELTYNLIGASDPYLQKDDVITNTLYSATFALSSLLAFTKPVISPLSKCMSKKRIDRNAVKKTN